MDTIFNFTVPFFAVAGLGYLAARRGLLRDGAVAGLNMFVFYFALPALLVRALGRQDIAAIFHPLFFGGYLGASLALFALGALLARLLFGAGLPQMAISGQAAAVPNLGFLGLPLAIAVHGEIAAGPFAMAMIIDLVILVPLAIALLEVAQPKGADARSAWRATLAGMVLNPFLLSIAAGVAVALSGGALPGPVDRFAEFLGAAAGPAALFALGATLADKPTSSDWAPVAVMVVLKLIVHPLAVWLLLGQLLGLRAELLAVAVTLAAMPIASNVFVIAEQYRTLPRRASTAILLSTALGVLTVAAVLELL